MIDRLTWLGHATVLVEVGGARLLTDPVLRRRVAHLRRHAPAVPAPRDVDAVLLSHAHRDHLDLPTLRRLQPRPPLVVAPRGVGRTLRRLTGAEVRELEPGETTAVGPVRVVAVPAVHRVRRSPLGPASGALGFVVQHGGRRVYFAGDTEAFPQMADLGPLDAALLPIWGWGTSLGPGHMDPVQAADAVALLRPRLAVPIHWGTLLPLGVERRRGHVLRDPVDAFVRAAAERHPQTRVAVLAPGEAVDL
ncbi:MAG: MBL fold metallo-hydrolase [Solirubrobacteraceae bacterium]|nr:MBL fold metallo-hydrolase [Solirubrobacteraceae bacterium]